MNRGPDLFPQPLRLFALALALLAAPAHAHEGPPYPIVVDRTVGPYRLSVWADPDVGTGTYFVSFDPEPPRNAPDYRVTIEVWPTTSRLARASHSATRERDGAYRAAVAFDREEEWQTRLIVEGVNGRGEITFPVAVTPPGYGRWDLLIYLAPFLLVGGLWALVALRRRRRAVDSA
jgi:hypothetical protein